MKVAVVGAGYVGLVTATCLSEVGNSLVVYDNNVDRIKQLEHADLPFYEPGLADLIRRNVAENRLEFVSELETALEGAYLLFIAVGTPSDIDGSADISDVLSVARQIGRLMTETLVIVNKSTVPVGTAVEVRLIIESELEIRGLRIGFSVASNPEFLKEGEAINDFMKPDRIVVGADNEEGLLALRQLYAPFQRNRPCLIELDIKSAELSKYAANAMLANRISFMNEMSRLAERVGADIENVRMAIGSDPRIGHDFLYAGCGYGGSCFPKDTRALLHMGKNIGCELPLLDAVNSVNENQRLLLLKKVLEKFNGEISNLDFAIWGLTFKPNTDDMRESPSLPLINGLLDYGARVRAFDPMGNQQAMEIFANRPNFTVFDDMYELLDGCVSLILVTEWKQFRSPNFKIVKSALSLPIIFDGRNQWDPNLMKKLGFEYSCIGRSLNV